MTQIIPQLATLGRRYDAVFCDLWGCLHNGKVPFPDAVAALQGFRAIGGTVLLLTNAPRPKPSVVAQLDAMGVPRDAWDEVVTSGDAAQYAMLTGAVGRRIHFIGAVKDEPFFTEFSPDLTEIARDQPPIQRVPLDEAEGIICTGLVNDLTETPDDYRATLLSARINNLPFLCANPDIIVDYGDQRLYCAGALAAAYEALGGTALYFGKPHPPIYDLARRRLSALLPGQDPAILCIGDGIDTDIQGGQSEDLDTLFVTGGISANEFGSDPANPDPALLEKWLHAAARSPTLAIGHLR
ncbi:MAG: TIGR01459 family HAD-type hydrolase [Candidatus Saccharibacteria bacterium]|nr:TIGR01459 family HAD-type hydrolase [Pseudorhodobacter sp.]